MKYFRECANHTISDWSGETMWKCTNRVPNWILTPYCAECNTRNRDHAQKEDYERNTKDNSLEIRVSNNGYYGYQNGFMLFTKALENGITVNEFVNHSDSKYKNGEIEIMNTSGDCPIKLEYEEMDEETGKVIDKKIINVKRLRLMEAKWI